MKEEDEAVLAIKDLTISMHSFTFALALFALVEELPEDFDFSLLSKLQQLSTYRNLEEMIADGWVID